MLIQNVLNKTYRQTAPDSYLGIAVVRCVEKAFNRFKRFYALQNKHQRMINIILVIIDFSTWLNKHYKNY